MRFTQAFSVGKGLYIRLLGHAQLYDQPLVILCRAYAQALSLEPALTVIKREVKITQMICDIALNPLGLPACGLPPPTEFSDRLLEKIPPACGGREEESEITQEV